MERKLTHGGKLVGIEFNPSGDEKVLKAKELSAQLIDLVESLPVENGSSDRLNFIKDAVSNIIVAQMLVVKAVTYR